MQTAQVSEKSFISRSSFLSTDVEMMANARLAWLQSFLSRRSLAWMYLVEYKDLSLTFLFSQSFFTNANLSNMAKGLMIAVTVVGETGIDFLNVI